MANKQGLRVQLFKAKAGSRVHPWYLRLRAANGEVIMTSEGYYSKWNAKRAAKKMFPYLPLEDLTAE